MAGSGLQWQKWVLNVPLEELLKPVKKYIFTLDSKDWLEVPPVEFFKHKITLSEKEMLNYIKLNSVLQVELQDDVIPVSELHHL